MEIGDNFLSISTSLLRGGSLSISGSVLRLSGCSHTARIRHKERDVVLEKEVRIGNEGVGGHRAAEN